MIRRCGDPQMKGYANYGGRGITVCARWRDDFWAFVEDMGPRPTPQHSVERIENDGQYEPGNCRWATDGEQKLNTRRNRVITHKGITLPITAWARRAGIHPATLFWRLRKGIPVETALTAVPVRGHAVGQPSLGERLDDAGLQRSAYHARIAAGWTPYEALTTPRYQRRHRKSSN